MEYSNIIKGKKGAVLLFAALLLPLLFAFAGLAFDLGNMYALHSRLQNSADASALAGAAVFDARTDSEKEHTASDRAAAKFLRFNNESLEGIKMDPPQVRLGSNDRYYYRVRLRQEVPYYILRYFRSVLGDYINISATAYAMIPSYRYGEGDGSGSGNATGIFENLFTAPQGIYGIHSHQNPDVTKRYDLTTKEGVEKAHQDNQTVAISSFYNGDIVVGTQRPPGRPNNSTWLQPNTLLFNSGAMPYKGNVIDGLMSDLTAYVNKPTFDPALNVDSIKGYESTAREIAGAATTFQGAENGEQTFKISKDINKNGPAYNGYRYTNHNGGDLWIDTSLQGDSNEPFYVIVDDAENPQIHLGGNGAVDNVRPIIYCYLGTKEVHVSVTRAGSTFRGIIYAPNAETVYINANGWNFYGSIVTKFLNLWGEGTYHQADYLGGGNSGDQGQGEHNNKNIILVLPPEGITWDD